MHGNNKSLFCFPRWHDAGTYDAKTKTGGANGSIRNEEEYTHGANSGLKIALDMCGRLFFWFIIYLFATALEISLLNFTLYQ